MFKLSSRFVGLVGLRFTVVGLMQCRGDVFGFLGLRLD